MADQGNQETLHHLVETADIGDRKERTTTTRDSTILNRVLRILLQRRLHPIGLHPLGTTRMAVRTELTTICNGPQILNRPLQQLHSKQRLTGSVPTHRHSISHLQTLRRLHGLQCLVKSFFRIRLLFLILPLLLLRRVGEGPEIRIGSKVTNAGGRT